jgi:hypothetical protein
LIYLFCRCVIAPTGRLIRLSSKCSRFMRYVFDLKSRVFEAALAALLTFICLGPR